MTHVLDVGDDAEPRASLDALLADCKVQIDALRSELRQLGRFGRLLGDSPAMQRLYDRIQQVAPTDTTVLLVGESGTGKELAARTLHELSRRRSRPFVVVDCSAASPSLVESRIPGAQGGTLFLDEITEMPTALQDKLPCLLDADVRVLAATNRDPQAALREGKLRADLYSGLNVFSLQMPPLRERDGDAALLAQHFLDALNRQHGTRKTLAPAVLAQLVAHPWPGNVRELHNYVQRAFILADTTLDAALTPDAASAAAEPGAPSVSIPVGTSLAEADKQLILATLQRCGGVKTQSAELLGISVKTLYNRLGEYRMRNVETQA